MIETKTLLPGVTLRSCRDDRFKQGCLSFQLVRPMAKEESAKNVLIPSVLLRGTKRCPDLRAITENLDELYGASVSPLVRRVGDYQTTGLYCGFMDDRFALPGDRVLAPMLRFLEEILLDFPTEGEGFLPAFGEGEKKNLISTIDSELNDKRTYAMGKLLKTMCRGDSFGLPRFWAVLWAKLRFPVAAVAGYFALFFLYALSQDGRQPWRNIWPGTMAALGAWLALNWLYSTYVENFADYSLLYGSIGTAIALLIWLYMTAVTLIMGAELNATLISLRKDRAGES